MHGMILVYKASNLWRHTQTRNRDYLYAPHMNRKICKKFLEQGIVKRKDKYFSRANGTSINV
jgi:hypothetical protein